MSKRLTLSDLAGKVGPGCLALSPDLQSAITPKPPEDHLRKTSQMKKIRVPKPKKKTRPEMEMGAMLQMQKDTGVIASFDYEAITLVIGDPPCRFTADYACFLPCGRLRLVETKGPYIREDARIKFLAARKQYPLIQFQLWQRDKEGSWNQLI